MNAGTATARQVAGLRECCHPTCIVCGERNNSSLGLRFEPQPDGSVVGRFACEPHYQGYPDRLHGGVVAMLLDAAMTHCLFARQVRGVTAKLAIRYRHPIEVGVEATIRAHVVRESSPLYVLEAEIQQRDTVRVVAEGKFLGQPPAKSAGEPS